MIEPSNAERAGWPDATRDYVAALEAAGHYTEAHERLDDLARERVAAAERKLAEAVAALEAVRDDITDERGLNAASIVCTVWHSQFETTVDFIGAALDTLKGPAA